MGKSVLAVVLVFLVCCISSCKTLPVVPDKNPGVSSEGDAIEKAEKKGKRDGKDTPVEKKKEKPKKKEKKKKAKKKVAKNEVSEAQIKKEFLNGDFNTIIAQIEKLSRKERKKEKNHANVYYAALSYLHQEKYAEARETLDFLRKYAKRSISADTLAFKTAESYFAERNFDAALKQYLSFVDEYNESPYMSTALYRIAFSYRRQGDFTQSRTYFDTLEKKYPFSMDAALLDKDERLRKDCYFVQVGSFTDHLKAKEMKDRLTDAGFAGSLVKAKEGEVRYLVVVGAYENRDDAESCAARLRDKKYETLVQP